MMDNGVGMEAKVKAKEVVFTTVGGWHLAKIVLDAMEDIVKIQKSWWEILLLLTYQMMVH